MTKFHENGKNKILKNDFSFHKNEKYQMEKIQACLQVHYVVGVAELV